MLVVKKYFPSVYFPCRTTFCSFRISVFGGIDDIASFRQEAIAITFCFFCEVYVGNVIIFYFNFQKDAIVISFAFMFKLNANTINFLVNFWSSCDRDCFLCQFLK